MVRSRNTSARTPRQGFILLVVISMLVLFSLLGIAFVIYAQSEADIAKAARDAEVVRRPDMDPEMLLAYFLGQVVYDTNDTTSGLRGHSLARTMYGAPGNVVPFNGTGRLRSSGNYWNLDYTNYSGTARNPDSDGSGNPPYTYPDVNSYFLAAVKADGTVMLPSYYRQGPGGPVTLRPKNISAAFPAADANGLDVKNLSDSASGYHGGVNDSYWIDAGFPVMKAPDGRKYKALVAPLIVDLDNRINVNVHGYWINTPVYGFTSNKFDSHQGWGPWEVNPTRVISNTTEASNLFTGTAYMPGRYDISWSGGFPSSATWGSWSYGLNSPYGPGGPFYSITNYDSDDCNFNGFAAPQTGSCFPTYSILYENGGFSLPAPGGTGGVEMNDHPRNYNFFSPRQNSWSNLGIVGQNDRSFPPSSMEGLLRYGDTGSPALASPLFALCPQTLSNPRMRRLMTTHSFDLLRPGLTPYWTSNAAGSYPLSAGATAPVGQSVASPAAGASPGGEFGTNWGAVSAALGRIDLNRKLTDYPPLVDPTGNVTTQNGVMNLTLADPTPIFPGAKYSDRYNQAVLDRQNLAKDIFTVLWQVTGAPNPATVAPPAAAGTPSPDYDGLRWLAQLAVNIVDYIDNDDYITPFNWNPAATTVNNGWVFGTELPRLVLNEAYTEIDNDPNETPTVNGAATKPYKVNFWLELYNPVSQTPVYGYDVALSDSGNARLYFPGAPTTGNNAPYAGYEIVVATADTAATPDLKKPDNVLGEADYPAPMAPATGKTKLVVSDYTPETAPPKPLKPTVLAGAGTPDGFNVVLPSAGAGSGPQGSNKGYYVIGPNVPFPGTATNANFFATLPVKDNGQPDGPTHNALAYGLPNTTDLIQTPLPTHTILLRRLACPYLPYNGTPGPGYNPYVTIDYIDQVPSNDGVTSDSAGKHKPKVAAPFNSVGRNQPYASAAAQRVNQSQMPAPTAPTTPQNTFFQINTPNSTNNLDAKDFDWLVFMDRPLVSPGELLSVSAYKPHQLTQQFINANALGAKHNHRAFWFDEDLAGAGQTTSHRLYRFFEFVEAGTRLQWSPMGGRVPGKINLNTVWDQETFNALCDAQAANQFSQTAVNNIWGQMTSSRTPGGTPGANDNPFWGIAGVGFTTAGDAQYPNGSGVDSTLLRSWVNSAGTRLRVLEPDPTVPGAFNPDSSNKDVSGIPYFRYELLSKIFNNTTTRSNVFAVYLTVGFFEVVDDTKSPVVLGAEIGSQEGRSIRHRMFAIVDRSNLSVAFTNNGGTPQPTAGAAGPRPFITESQTAVLTAGATSVQVGVLNVSGSPPPNNYEDLRWAINVGDQLIIDSGSNQEVVTVTAAGGSSFSANFSKAHALGFQITNALLGHPGPQPRFDPRNPQYGGIVRYLSIIQ